MQQAGFLFVDCVLCAPWQTGLVEHARASVSTSLPSLRHTCRLAVVCKGTQARQLRTRVCPGAFKQLAGSRQ
eukprot:10814511-Alexandrium_andersonii.AAC.1